MIGLVTAALTTVAGDAVVRFNGEVVWLLRAGGLLTVSDRDDFWQPDLLALLPPAYTRASLPVL
jgi:hypothetical protein